MTVLGSFSLYGFAYRIWTLSRKDSVSRPIGASRACLDFFQWNFILGFLYVTVMISIGVSISNNDTSLGVRLVAMPLPSLVLQICGLILYAAVSSRVGAKYPFRVSSMSKGTPVRPAVYTIVEDVCAVDGGWGQNFRQYFNHRYEATSEVRTLLMAMDLLWGVSGTTVSIVLISLIWKLDDCEIGYALAWLVPWIWAVSTATLTVLMTRAAMRRADIVA